MPACHPTPPAGGASADSRAETPDGPGQGSDADGMRTSIRRFANHSRGTRGEKGMSKRQSRWLHGLAPLVGLMAIFAACSPTASPSASSGTGTSSQPPASSGPAASASAVAQAPVTIPVRVLRPGATQEAVDALNLQISEFEAKYPWITVEPEEYN